MFMVFIAPFPKSLAIDTVNDFALVWFKRDRAEVLVVGCAHTEVVRNCLITALREIGNFLTRIPSDHDVCLALNAIAIAWRERDIEENVADPIELFLKGQSVGCDIPERCNLVFMTTST